MTFIRQLFGNYLLVCAIGGWLGAQIIKSIIAFAGKEKLSLMQILFSNGGMPSSHSAAVCATCFSCGILYGYDSAFFAISGVLAAVVMRDAAGIRREAGKQAEVINRISDELNKNNKKKNFEDTLKVLLGHTPLQVVVGAFLGVLMAFFCQYVLFPAILPVTSPVMLL